MAMAARLGCAVCSVMLAVGSWAVAQPTPPASAPASRSVEAPQIEVNSTTFDFGEVWQGEPVKGEIQVKNTGTAPLVLDVKSSCGCAVPTRPKSPLAPGEATSFTISYDTMKRRGLAHQTVTLTSNDPARPSVEIRVEGNVKPLYDTEPAAGLSFHQLRTDSRDSRKIKFINKYDGPLHLKLKAGQDFRPFEVTLTETTPGMEFELTTTTVPPLSEEVSRLEIVLETGLERTPELSIPVQAYVQPDVLVRPSMLRMARQATVATQQAVQLSYREDKPVKIVEIRPSHASIQGEILPNVTPSGRGWAVQTIRVTLPPGNELPPGNAQLEILTDSPEPRFQKMVVRIHVIEPEARRDDPARAEARGSSAPATTPAGTTGQTPVPQESRKP